MDHDVEDNNNFNTLKLAATNMQGIETAFECVLSFHFRDSWSHGLYITERITYHIFHKIRYLSVVTSPYTVCGK